MSSKTLFIKKSLNITQLLIKRYITSQHNVVLENISHFGILRVRCPLLNINIKSIDPHDNPNGDKVYVELKDLKKTAGINISQVLDVDYDNVSSVLSVTQICTSIKDLVLNLDLPHHFDIDVEANKINIKETEGNILKIKSNEDCTFGKIKSFNIDLNISGELRCRNLYGNGNISCKQNIRIGKLQTKNMNIESVGYIDINDIYSTKMTCKSDEGNINFGNFHGSCKLNTNNGDINIGSSSGELTVNSAKGNISVILEYFNECLIHSNSGDIDIGIGENVSSYIEAKGNAIDIPETLLIDGIKGEESNGTQYFEGKLGDAKSNLNVQTNNGFVSLSKKNWFSKFELDN